MTDQTHNVHDDISFMRQMAEQGRRGPILGGIFLAASGFIYGVACFVQWAMQTGLLPPPTAGRAAELWGGATALWVVVWLVMFLNLRKSTRAMPGVAQTAFGSAWAACGLGIMVMMVAIAITASRLHNPSLMALMPLIVFAFYGTAWCVSGALARQKWMFSISIAAFAIALIMAALPDSAMLLVMGAGLFATLVAPGLLLMRKAGN